MHDYVSRTIGAYDESPLRYEEATKGMAPDRELDDFLALVPDSSGRVLDVGCAFGRDTALLAQRGMQAEGVDLSRAFVERAQMAHPGLSFRTMDARRLDFPDGSFAGLWCHAMLLHLKDADIAVALTEFFRVLAPGGAVFVSFKEGEGEEEIIERFSSDHARFYRYQSASNVEAMLGAAGFGVAAIERSNELERFGPGHRDLTWIHAFATKPSDRQRGAAN